MRKHLDYVATHQFHARTNDEEFNTSLETWFGKWSQRNTCDIAGKFSLSKLIRLAEARSVIDGDILLVLLGNGTIQAIESDRVKDPEQLDPKKTWVNGVMIDPAGGRHLAYGIHRRANSGYSYERMVRADNAILHAKYDRFDQIRGISPLACAIASMQDLYENFDYALAKAKVSQLFALALFRENPEGIGAEDTGTGHKIDFSAGPQLLDMSPGDEAKFLESNTPSNQFQDFSRLMLMVVCKSLDIPYSFFDESHTNFFGSRGAWLHYDRSCEDKRRDVQQTLDEITRWRLSLAVLDGEIKLPRGVSLDDSPWEWVPQGVPWWDPVKEINGDLMAIRAGLTTPQRVCKERGQGDYFDNVQQIAKAMTFAREQGVQLAFDPAPIQTIEVNNAQQ